MSIFVRFEGTKVDCIYLVTEDGYTLEIERYKNSTNSWIEISREKLSINVFKNNKSEYTEYYDLTNEQRVIVIKSLLNEEE